MHGADEDVDLIALDELVGVVGRLGGIGLVVDGEVLDLPPPSLPPFSSIASLKPLVIAVPSAANVPV
jgi:hypothetical protein